jgi:phosphohistidine phosphatase
MEIYLMRHGEAVHAGEWRGSDGDRPLTAIGEALLESGVKEMKRVGFLPAVILTSPFLRAKQTAEIVAKGLGLSAPVPKEEFSSGSPLETMRRAINANMAQAPLLIVGHMPEIAILGSRITTEPNVMGDGLEPADVLAIDPGPLDKTWGDGKVLWWRKIKDWKKVHP